MIRNGKASRRVAIIGATVLCALYLWLVLPGLGEYAFWFDEAGTALFARNVLDAGYPSIHYGDNVLNHGPYDRNFAGVDANHGWLGYYLCALSFATLGESEWAGRIGFVLFGLATILAVVWLGRSLYGTAAGLFAGLLLTLQPSFLQYARQCRYYAPAMFFSVATVGAYLAVRHGKRHWLWLCASAFLLFQSSQTIFLAVAAALVIWEFVLADRLDGEPVSPFPRAHILAVCAALIVPWIVFFMIGRQNPRLAWSATEIAGHARIAFSACLGYFPFLFLFGLVPARRDAADLTVAGVALASLAVIVLLPESTFSAAGGFHRRYVLHMLPLGALVAARGILVLRDRRVAAVALALAAVSFFALPDRWNWAARGADDVVDNARTLAAQFRFYREPPKPNPERRVLNELAHRAARYTDVYVDAEHTTVYLHALGPRNRVLGIRHLDAPPVTRFWRSSVARSKASPRSTPRCRRSTGAGSLAARRAACTG